MELEQELSDDCELDMVAERLDRLMGVVAAAAAAVTAIVAETAAADE